MHNFENKAKLAFFDEITDLFFQTLETLCKRSLSEDESVACAESGTQSAILLVHMVLERLPEEHQSAAFHDIQQRFLDALITYDKPWVWEVFKGFSSVLPETTLN